MASRRRFLQNTLMASAGLALPHLVTAEHLSALNKKIGANDQLNYGLIGCNGMGFSNMTAHLKMPEVNCVALADIDQSVLDRRAADVDKIRGKKPKLYKRKKTWKSALKIASNWTKWESIFIRGKK